MKKSFILIIIILINLATGLSQENTKTTGFSNVQISYNMSIMDNDVQFIPYGLGIESEYSLGSRFSTNFGIIYKTSGNKYSTVDYPASGGNPSYSSSLRYSDSYLDIPLHLNYTLISKKGFNLNIHTGPKFTTYFRKNFLSETFDSMEPENSTDNWTASSLGLDFGFTESFNINNNLGIFFSQTANYGLFGFQQAGRLSFDFKIGVQINLNRKK